LLKDSAREVGAIGVVILVLRKLSGGIRALLFASAGGVTMIRIFTNADQPQHSKLFREMFRGRAVAFYERLRWDVVVRDGMERDHYDYTENPTYILATDCDGTVVGSLRLLPTIGETMLRNEFSKFFSQPLDVKSSKIWECTRFCVHSTYGGAERGLAQSISSELLMGLCQFAMSTGIEKIIGLYEAHMARIYRQIGWSPQPLALARAEFGKLIVGLWDVSHAALDAMRICAETSRGDFHRAA
jgi:N-acyl-L-homoserine lactone synthetase